MSMRKKLLSLLLAAAFLSIMSVPAFAHDVPDMGRKGSINIEVSYDGKPVSGGTLTAYRVAEIAEDDGNYSFALIGDFARSGESLTDIASAALAEKLAGYAGETAGETKPIDGQGKVSFTGLELGLYLLVQDEAAKGYSKIAPFLVSVPMNEDGVYLYDVDASPKAELKKAPQPSPTPCPPSGSKLPQTGQLNWPVPVLVLLGLGLFSAGWLLCLGKRDGYEK